MAKDQIEPTATEHGLTKWIKRNYRPVLEPSLLYKQVSKRVHEAVELE